MVDFPASTCPIKTILRCSFLEVVSLSIGLGGFFLNFEAFFGFGFSTSSSTSPASSCSSSAKKYLN